MVVTRRCGRFILGTASFPPRPTDNVLPMKPTLAIALLCVFTCSTVCAQDELWKLRPNEVIAMLGGTNAVNMQNAAVFETLLTIKNAEAKPRFVDLAWEGDTVYRQGTVIERWREEKFGDLANQLKENRATLIVVQFGQNEALEGALKLGEFAEAFAEFLSVCKRDDRRVIVVSPIPFEKSNELQPDLSKRNRDLAKFVAAMKELASKQDSMFVDLFSNLSKREGKLTGNGMHIAPAAHRDIAEELISTKWNETFEPLREAVSHKHRLWMNYWRPANWKCLYGDDGRREFGKATAGGLTLRQEWAKLPAMISESEDGIWAMAKKLKEQK